MTDRIARFESGPATTFYVEGDLHSQSIAGNYSVVRCYLRAKNGPGGTTGSQHNEQGYQAGTIAGVKEFARKSGKPFLPAGYADNQQRWRLGPYDVQVPHNSDGTRDPIRFGMVLNYPGHEVTVFSADMALPTIARATTAQVRVGSTTVTSLDVGTAATIYLPRASSSFTHTVELWEYAGDGSALEILATGVGVSYAWTPPLSLAAMFPDATSKQFFIRARTFSGSTEIGRRDTIFTLRAPASMVPTISAINVADDNPTVASAIGGFVQGQSRLKATVVAAGVQGSSITSSAFSVDGQSAASGEALPLPLAGTRTVAASATDSRGRVGTANGTVAVLPYELPKVNDFLVERATSAGAVSPNGTYLRMTLNAAISSLIVGAQKNSMTVRVFTRPRGTSAWTARNVITAALAYNTSVLITGGGIYATNTAYDVRVEVHDKLQKSEDYWAVSTAGAIIDADATKQAFGKMIEASGPDTQIQGPARVYGTLDVDEELRSPGLYQNGRKTLSLQETLYFTSSGSFAKASYPWLQAVRVRLVGGGGAGGGAGAGGSGHSAGGGGGGGGYAEAMIPVATLPASVAVTVGAGAVGIQGDGPTGGSSSFGSLVAATGGVGGGYFTSNTLMIGAVGGIGGIGTAGSLQIQGAPGGMGSGYATLAHGAEGGSSQMGGGGTGRYTGAGGGSGPGIAGGNYGGGGGGAAVNQSGAANSGGAGAPGIVIVELYA